MINACIRCMRLDKPVGIFLLWFPVAWSLWLIYTGTPPLQFLSLFFIGTFLMRSAGCVINDIADRNFDPFVARTLNRPLAAGDLSLTQAIILAIILCGFAFIVLIFLPRACFIYAIFGLCLTAFYPFCKRFFHAPQCILGLAFSIGIPMTFVAAGQSLSWLTYTLIIINVLWVLAYDTQYALIDKKDDLKLNLKSTAILFGNYDRHIILALNICVQFLWLFLAQYQNLKTVFYIFWLIAGLVLIFQAWLIQKREPLNCFIAFQSNLIYGILIWLGLIFGV